MNESTIISTLLKALPIIQGIDTLTGSKLMLAYDVYEAWVKFSQVFDGVLSDEALRCAEYLNKAVINFSE